jgi:hypothetical protein
VATAATAILPPVIPFFVVLFGVILVVISVNIVDGIVASWSLLLSWALTAINATIALASIIVAAIVVAAAAATAALSTTLPSMQPLQRLSSMLLLQPLLLSLPSQLQSPPSLLLPSLPPPPPLLRPCPHLHCHHCCSLHQHHHASNTPIDGWLLYCPLPLTCFVVPHPNLSDPAVVQLLMLLPPGHNPLLPTIASRCPVALVLSINCLCHSL